MGLGWVHPVAQRPAGAGVPPPFSASLFPFFLDVVPLCIFPVRDFISQFYFTSVGIYDLSSRRNDGGGGGERARARACASEPRCHDVAIAIATAAAAAAATRAARRAWGRERYVTAE